MSTQFQLKCPALYGRSLAEAKRLQHSYIGVEHLALALLRDVGSPLSGALSQVGIDANTLISLFEMEVGSGKPNTDILTATPRLDAIVSLAESDGYLTPRTLARSILIEGENLFVRLLISRDVAIQSLLATIDGVKTRQDSDDDATRYVNSNIQSAKLATSLAPPKTPAPLENAVGARIQPKIATPVTFPTPTLGGCGRDLRILAGQGRLKDACGREREIEQMITILARTQKSNPILLGDAGVGKTAIVEALAWRIAEGLVPPILRGKRIVELQMGELMAGTQLRGQFEQRIQQVIKEATDAPDVILFIDEIHTLVGAGRSQGSANDAAQMLKPALARGDISCIGATTEDEFSRYIRKDPALERRFSPVIISELSPSATLRILDGIASNIVRKQAEGGFQILISPGALSAAVTLTDAYVKNRNQPDKSIDAIDIACARAVVQGRSIVNADDVALVISEWTGIPVGRLSASDRQRYAQIEATLEQRVIGQNSAIAAVSRSVRASLAGMKAPNRPVGVFLFIGPSGVGKTKLAKELASFLFGSESALIRFDMNEYQDKHTLTNLIGSARGYLGSDQGGQFTEALRRNPYSVVLLDEIEKAHPDILNAFLAVFDDGRITDNQGQVVDCSNAIFVLTSNMGMTAVVKDQAGTEDLRELAGKFMKPELVNRITEVVRFEPLGAYELELVLDQVLTEKLAAFFAAQQLEVSVDGAARKLMLSVEFDPQMGARPLERVVERMLVQPLVDALFAGQIKPGFVAATARAGRIVFSATMQEG